MAQMIPSDFLYNNDNKDNTAEEIMFDIIKKEPNTQDWIVFHSLEIKSHECKITTESDFVILIPTKGIFVIEVKGGGIQYRNGQFFSIDRYGNPHEINNPFKQVEKEKYGIKNYLKSKYIENVLICTGVAFTSVEYNIDSIEYDKNQVFNIKKGSFYDYINNLWKLERNKGGYFKSFSGDIFDQVRQVFRADYDLFVPPYQQQKENNYHLSKRTSQQLKVLDSVSMAERAIVHGGAGTGKTLLAIDLAKRCYNNGYKVGIFSFNILLADFIAEQFPKEKYPKIVTGAIKEYWTDYCKNVGLIENDFNPWNLTKDELQKYYNKDIYKLTLEALYLKPLDLDVLILDEAQDFVYPENLIILSLMLKNGFARSKWYMFGDFKNQLIFDSSVYETTIRQYLKSLGADSFLDKELSINCRNSGNVAKELAKLSGLELPLNEKDLDGIVEYQLYNDEMDEVEKLDGIIEKLIEHDKIPPENITVLSNKVFEDSAVQLSKYINIMKRYENRSKGIITYSRIRRFKGLENDIIIMLDLNDYTRPDMDKECVDLIYAGLSRAKHSCYILENEKEKKVREQSYKEKENNNE